jgi:hypothetical protein
VQVDESTDVARERLFFGRAPESTIRILRRKGIYCLGTVDTRQVVAEPRPAKSG